MPRQVPQSTGDGGPAWRSMVELVLPILLVSGVALGWILLFRPRQAPASVTSTPPRVAMTRAVPTQAPTLWGTAAAPEDEVTYRGTALPTFTPTAPGVTTPTAGLDMNPAGLKVGEGAKITGTGGSGLNMRTEAASSSPHIRTLREGTVVELLDGPLQGGQHIWWKVRDDDGNTGWVVGQYLVPD